MALSNRIEAINLLREAFVEFYGLLYKINNKLLQGYTPSANSRVAELGSLYYNYESAIMQGYDWLEDLDDESIYGLLRDSVLLARYYNLNVYSKLISRSDLTMRNYNFRSMSVVEQYEYLCTMVELGENADGPTRGGIAGELRRQREYMKLDGLFAINEPFMNIRLRNFLNLSKNGAEDYLFDEINMEGSGWTELPSIGAQYHQTTAPKDMVAVSKVEYTRYDLYQYAYNKLNAKFTHSDGREVVFSHEKRLVTNDIDKGTYNYYPGEDEIDLLRETVLPGGLHNRYDVAPYKRQMKANGYTIIPIYEGSNRKNSDYWDLLDIREQETRR